MAQVKIYALRTVLETPKHHWGIRGLPGDELALEYTVEV
jgi:hypothetical protein